MSFKRGEPEWGLPDVDGVRALPAVQWKLKNLARLDTDKRAQALTALYEVLGRVYAT